MESPHVFDLEAYRDRIGFSGRLEPTVECLRELAIYHASAVPFENLDVLLKRGIQLEPEALEQKLVFDRRGGYCFEQNGLMLGILSQIGFEVTPLAGRVRLDRPRDVLPPRTHLFLSVELDDEHWLFDVGVGGFSLTSPIRRFVDGEQSTRHETRRIVAEEGKFFHQVWTGSLWLDAYEFSGERMPPIDREVGNWWTSTSPRAKFSQNLMCARAAENGERFGIMNDRFIRRKGAEIIEEIKIESADQLLDVLDKRFGLIFPAGTHFGSGEKPWPTT